MRVAAVIPVLNEEDAISDVVMRVRQYVPNVIVVDGNSQDRTAERARVAGAVVVVETRRGYGQAMQSGLAHLPEDTEIVLFVDGDGSDRVELIPSLVAPIASGAADFVHGTRMKGEKEAGALSPPQVVAGHLAGLMMRALYSVSYSDMSPFRAIRRDALECLGMQDLTYGWNIEMQMRAAARGLRIVEVPVGQRVRRGGVSKVSGDLTTALRVSWVLTKTIATLALTLRRERHS